MPVEGQWRRVSTPLNRRDKRVLAGVGALAAAALIAVGAVEATKPGSSPPAGCVVADVPSTMGAGHLEACGAKARALCRTQAAVDPAIAAACRRAGYATGSP